MPQKDRWLACAVLRYRGKTLLLDCGEGTQIALKESGFRTGTIGTICLTHFHADHVAGLPGLLLTMGNMSLVLTLVCFALVTSSTLAINTLFVSILPLRFVQHGRASTLSGALNAVAYAGSAAAAAVIGFLSERFGWGANVASWLIGMALALAMCLAGRPVRLTPKGAE
jgi:OPA family glycerol-3-phosphate transporter-like MFS transporter